MKKILVIFLLCFCFITPVNGLVSKNAILVDLTNDTILMEKNADEKVSVASLTKIVTAITVIENEDNLNKKVTFKRNMLDGLTGYSRAGLKLGYRYSYEELLYATLLPSGADAAQALAISMSGSIDNFAILMNNEINKIGVTNSHFSNPVGMDDKQNYSTAKDMYKILKYALNNETFKKIFETKEYIISNSLKLENTIRFAEKKFNIDASIIKGDKSGYTESAGRCFASTASINGINYLMINLKAPEDSLDFILDPIEIYNYYKENYSYNVVKKKGDVIYSIRVINSKENKFDVVLKDDVTLLFDKNRVNDIKIKYHGASYINRLFNVNDKLGTIDFVLDNKILYTMDVYLDKEFTFYNEFVSINLVVVILIIDAILAIEIIIVNNKRKLTNN